MTHGPPDRVLGPLLERAGVGVAVLDGEGRFVAVNDRLAMINGVPAERHLGRTLHEVIPHIADAVVGLHRQVLATGEPVRDVQIRGSTAGASDRIWQASYLPTDHEGERAVGVLLQDVTEREEASANLERRLRQQRALADLSRRALFAGELDGLLEAACSTVRAQLEGDLAEVLPADRQGGALAALTLSEDRAVLSHDLAGDARFEAPPEAVAKGMVSAISAPMPGQGSAFGVLVVYSRSAGRFADEDADFVRAVANLLGAAAVRAAQARALEEMSEQRGRLVAQALDAGEREQRQVADILHDDVLQRLLFVRQELTEAAADPGAVARAEASVAESVALLRRVVAGLSPVTLAHAGLAAALGSLAEEHEARGGPVTQVRVEPEAAGVHDRLIMSLARELLTNVSKHADADRALVSVTKADGMVKLTVADNGRGMPDTALDSALAQNHIGLAIARERAEALGGMAQVCAGLDGGGTAVEIQLPH